MKQNNTNVPERDIDLATVEEVLSGNVDAFDSLVLKYQRQIAAVVVRMNGYHADVSDTIQKVFFKAYTKLSTFQRKSTFKTWLFSIAINTCRNDLRRLTKKRREDDTDDHVLEISASQERSILEKQRKEQLQKAMHELPPKQKETVSLRIHQELSFREIAEITETTENTAKVNFHHGMKRLREMVAD